MKTEPTQQQLAYTLCLLIAVSALGQGIAPIAPGSATALSSDGHVVIGGWRWDSGILNVVAPGLFATSISGDGNVACGWTSQSLAWVATGGNVTILPSLSAPPSSQASALGISTDGRVVVGVSQDSNGNFQPVQWIDSNVSGLPVLPGAVDNRGEARAASTDGSVIVGWSYGSGGVYATRWDNGAATSLGDLPGGANASAANAISPDGQVIVGYGETNLEDGVTGTREAVRWTGGGIEALGFLSGGVASEAFGVSADGQRIVGYSTPNPSSPSASDAFLWTPANGMQRLRDVLIGLGVDTSEWTLTVAHAISPDGRYVVGEAFYAPAPGPVWAFIADLGGPTLPPPGDTIAFTPPSYAMLNGEHSCNCGFRDETHSGSGDPNTDLSPLSAGTGQLTDGVQAGYSFGGPDVNNHFPWVGWLSIVPTITFDFGERQDFGQISIHTEAFAAAGVRVFPSAHLSFSDDGINFGNFTTYITTAAERANGTHVINIPVQASGRFARLSLHNPNLNGWYIMISEVTFASAAVATPPSILEQPQNQTVTAGNTIMFSVSAAGSDPLSYQWRKGGTPILGANSRELTFNTVAASDGGDYDVVVSNSAGSVTSATATLTVLKATPVITWPAPANIIYGTALGAAQLNAAANVPGTFTYSLAAGTVLHSGDGQTLTVNFTPIDPDTYFPASASVMINVGKAPLTVQAGDKSKVYGAVLPTLTASYTGFVNGDTAAVLTELPAISTTAKKSSSVGNYPITITGGMATDYDVTLVNGTLAITPAPLVVTAVDKNNVYGTALPTLTATYSGFVNGDSKADLDTPVLLATTATQSSDAGIYPIIANGASDLNYNITFVPGTLAVTPHALMIRAQNKHKTYGEVLPEFTASYSGFVNGDTPASLDTPVALTTSANETSPVGTYTITAADASDHNYTITFVDGTLTVDPAVLTVKAEPASKSYGAPVPPLTYTITGFVLGETEADLDTPVVINTTATAVSVVGHYPIEVSGASDANYRVRFVEATLTVAKAALTITADDKTRSYGEANPVCTATYSGFVNGDTEASLDTLVTLSTTAKTSSPPGNYVIKASAAKDTNYTITFVNGALTIVP